MNFTQALQIYLVLFAASFFSWMYFRDRVRDLKNKQKPGSRRAKYFGRFSIVFFLISPISLFFYPTSDPLSRIVTSLLWAMILHCLLLLVFFLSRLIKSAYRALLYNSNEISAKTKQLDDAQLPLADAPKISNPTTPLNKSLVVRKIAYNPCRSNNEEFDSGLIKLNSDSPDSQLSQNYFDRPAAYSNNQPHKEHNNKAANTRKLPEEFSSRALLGFNSEDTEDGAFCDYTMDVSEFVDSPMIPIGAIPAEESTANMKHERNSGNLEEPPIESAGINKQVKKSVDPQSSISLQSFPDVVSAIEHQCLLNQMAIVKESLAKCVDGENQPQPNQIHREAETKLRELQGAIDGNNDLLKKLLSYVAIRESRYEQLARSSKTIETNLAVAQEKSPTTNVQVDSSSDSAVNNSNLSKTFKRQRAKLDEVPIAEKPRVRVKITQLVDTEG